MFTKKELAECAQRELQKRRDNYPNWVRDRKMTQAVATRQIEMTQAIYRLLINMADQDVQNLQN